MPRPRAYPHEVLATVFQVRGGALEVLLWQRAAGPYDHHWALPGGSLGADERLGSAVARHLATKVDVTEIAHLEQLETRSEPDRDPRERVLATAYLGLIPTDVEPVLPDDTSWHPVEHLPPMAFDHDSIVTSARARLRAKLSYTSIGFALAPREFPMSQLRDVYSAALGHQVSATNLQRVLLRRGVLERTQAIAVPSRAGGRPAGVFRFREQRLVVTDEFPALRPAGGGRAEETATAR